MRALSFFTAFGMILVATPFCFGQVYSLKPRAEDEFSKVLVTLLNAAPGRFAELQGPFIHTTYLSENVYDLKVKLPGSRAAIVQSRDHSTNVYVEFQGYDSNEEVNEGIRQLSLKIKKALADQLYDRNRDTGQLWQRFTGYSIRDKNGFYGMNLEIFSGKTAFASYLLSPDREPENRTRHFILLKITGGLPYYYHFINERAPVLPSLHTVLQNLIAASKDDFSIYQKIVNGKRKKTDTLTLKGHRFFMKYRGSNFSATLQWENTEDAMDKLHRSLQQAAGASYVYYEYEVDGQKAYLYFDHSGDSDSPRIYLKAEGNYLLATIHSPVDHPSKRHLELDDGE